MALWWETYIRSAKQDKVYGAPYIVLPCPGSAIDRPLGIPCAKKEEEQMNIVLFVAKE
jgi:hypothetical protein